MVERASESAREKIDAGRGPRRGDIPASCGPSQSSSPVEQRVRARSRADPARRSRAAIRRGRRSGGRRASRAAPRGRGRGCPRSSPRRPRSARRVRPGAVLENQRARASAARGRPPRDRGATIRRCVSRRSRSACRTRRSLSVDRQASRIAASRGSPSRSAATSSGARGQRIVSGKAARLCRRRAGSAAPAPAGAGRCDRDRPATAPHRARGRVPAAPGARRRSRRASTRIAAIARAIDHHRLLGLDRSGIAQRREPQREIGRRPRPLPAQRIAGLRERSEVGGERRRARARRLRDSMWPSRGCSGSAASARPWSVIAARARRVRRDRPEAPAPRRRPAPAAG